MKRVCFFFQNILNLKFKRFVKVLRIKLKYDVFTQKFDESKMVSETQ